jgi:hypothetical protein
MSEATGFLIAAAIASATAITIFVALEGPVGLAYAIPFLAVSLLFARWLQGRPLRRRGPDSAHAPRPRLEGRGLWLALALALVLSVPGFWLEVGWLAAVPVLALAAASLAGARLARR